MTAARKPDYRITLGGETITPRIKGRLARLTLTDNRGLQADQLTLVLTDDDGRLELPRRGVELGLALGWEGDKLTERGTFIVDEVEHSGAPDLIHLRARSANLRGTFAHKRTRSWHQVTLGDIVKTIAGRHDLTPGVSDVLAGILIGHSDQTNESDANYLTRLAQRYDAIAAVKSGHLLFVSAGQAATVSGQPIPLVTLTRSDGDRHRFAETDRESYTGVEAYWHDTAAAERKSVLVGKDDDPKRLRPTYATEADAKYAAQSEWQRLQRGSAELSVTLATGRADLYPETPINVSGYKTAIDALPWLVTGVRHSVNGSAYTTALSLQLRNS